MTTTDGYRGPGRAHKRQSQAETRRALEAALARLRNGKPKVVDPNTKITVSSVARAAGVRRTTVHNYHPGIVTEIQQLADRAVKDQLQQKRTRSAQPNGQLRERKATIEQLQHEKTNLARINHALRYRNQELERQIAIQNEKLNQLMRRLNAPSKGAGMHTED